MMKNVILLLLLFVSFVGCDKEQNIQSDTEKQFNSALVKKEKKGKYSSVVQNENLSVVSYECRPESKTGCYIIYGASTILSLSGVGSIPACDDLNVNYSVQICSPNGNVTSISIFDFGWNINDSNSCPELWYYLDSLWDITDQELWAEALDQISYELSLVLEKKLVNDFIGTAECSDNNSSFDATFYENKCYNYCENGERILCGDVCCIRASEYCRENGEIKKIGWEFETVGGNCGGVAIDDECNSDHTKQNCEHDCGPLPIRDGEDY